MWATRHAPADPGEKPNAPAAVPFYGGQPSAAAAARIKAPLLLHYASLDTRINEGWLAYGQAPKANLLQQIPPGLIPVISCNSWVYN